MGDLSTAFDAARPVVIMSTPEMRPCAERLAALANSGKAPEGATRARCVLDDTLTWRRFADGTPNITFNAVELRGRDVVFLAHFDPRDVLSLMSVIYAVPRYLVRTFQVVLPYFPTGTMERAEREGDVATAKTVARMLGATPPPQLGRPTFVFYDLHALATRFFFSDSIHIALASAVPMVFDRLLGGLLFPGDKARSRGLVVAFPDQGAQKRFEPLLREHAAAVSARNSAPDGGDTATFHWPMVVCAKQRRGATRDITIIEGSELVSGRDVIIVDDLIMSGSTLLVTADLLFERGARSVSCYATHSVFPPPLPAPGAATANSSPWEQFMPDRRAAAGKQPLHRLVTTDSIPVTAGQLAEHSDFFTVISVADDLVNCFFPEAKA
jgi:phosphoribosylpyrophosphate synthetase